MFDVCANFESDQDIRELTIGYAKNSRILFLIIPSFALIANIGVIITYFFKKKNSKRNQASMDKLFFDLTVCETFISIYWLCNGIFFYKGEYLKDRCEGCFAASLLSIFLYCFDWILVTLTIYHLKVIIINPIEGILRTTRKIRLYEIIALICALVFTGVSFLTEIYGRSPMITCFIRTDFYNISGTITICILVIIPTLCGIYAVYQTFSMCCNKTLAGDRELKSLFWNYIVYIFIYMVFNAPMLLLYIITIRLKISPNTWLSWFSYFSCVLNCSIPLVITCVRIIQGYVRIDFWNICWTKHRVTSQATSYIPTDADDKLRTGLTEKEEFEWLEKKIMEGFMKDIFVGICYFLKISSFNTNLNQEIDKNDCRNTKEEHITFDNINFEDEIVKSSQFLDVHFIEFAPKVFSLLRRMEGLDEAEMINSLLPMKNRASIRQSQGKSGNFFICTDDNKYILKTVNPDELELIRCMLLKKFAKHLQRYPNSLLCRFYGLFKMVFSNGDEMIVLLMRNVIGSFKENVLCKYDLKGSSVNRKEDFECERVQKIVMKDINFDEIEKALVLSKVDTERLRFSATSDSYFLNDLEIMDYSLFVVKLSLSKSEIATIFANPFHHSASEEKIMTVFQTKDITEDELNNFLPGKKETKEINLQDLRYYQKYLFPSLNPNIVYIIAIIDYLQIYNFAKYLETNIKKYLRSNTGNAEAISCVPPNVYSARFIEYIYKITDVSGILKKQSTHWIGINDPVHSDQENNNSDDLTHFGN